MTEVEALKWRCTCDNRCVEAAGDRREAIAVLAVRKDMMNLKRETQKVARKKDVRGRARRSAGLKREAESRRLYPF